MAKRAEADDATTWTTEDISGDKTVTEAEWLECKDAQWMLKSLVWIERKASQRKLRLFGCAWCRRVWHLLEDQRSRSAVEITEKYVDGGSTKRQWMRAARAASQAFYDALDALLRKKETAVPGAWTPLGAALTASHASRKKAVFIASTTDANCEEQAVLVHEVFGNPFRPVAIDPAWLTWNDCIIPKLAQAIYDERAFDRMPILADALEEAGCNNVEILNHCRKPGEHVRGCWVVDALLGKS